ncbi:mutator type transposase [Tanacetum coccineum]
MHPLAGLPDGGYANRVIDFLTLLSFPAVVASLRLLPTQFKIEDEPPEVPAVKKEVSDLHMFRPLKDGFKAGEEISWVLDGWCDTSHAEIFPNVNIGFVSNTLYDSEFVWRAMTWLRDRFPPTTTGHRFRAQIKANILFDITCVSSKQEELLVMGLVEVELPCTHVVASHIGIRQNGIDTGIPESYCLPVHWLTTWKEMYKFKINPVNGPQGWKKSDVPTTIIPPKPHPQIGRPPKKRKKSAAELADEMMKSKKLTKTGKSVTCKSCKQVGHNSRGCKSKKGGGSQQAGVAGHGDAAHGSQQAGVHGSQTTQSTPQAS